jgi:hypothetical protein
MNVLQMSIAAATVALFGNAPAATIAPSAASPVNSRVASPPHLAAKKGVLYDQTDSDSGIAIVSQNFQSSFDAYDNAAADDFVVPAGHKWKISDIYATGQYFNGSGPADSFSVAFYTDKSKVIDLPTKPKAFCPAPGWQYTQSGNSWHWHCAHPVAVKPGKYWLSLVAVMDFNVGGEWGWENRTVTSGDAAAWENPGDGFATGCTTWSVENVCIPDGQGDHMFQLRGTSK